jgi:NADH dehydrogenase
MTPGTKVAIFTLLGVSAATFLIRRQPLPGGESNQPRCRVVVLGGGFGGLAAASKLAGQTGIDLTVIDATNHHLFQPLLYQVATAALSPSDIASPVRSILPAARHVRVLMETVTGIDTAGRNVLCDGLSIPYDQLVVATGSAPSYFGHPGWRDVAPSLKTLDDALMLRQRILQAFEQAATANPSDQDRLLTFVLIGGGPTGVEMAGSIAELANDMLARDYGLPMTRARILLVEAGDRILSAFAPSLSDYAAKTLSGLGVEIRIGTTVTGINPGEVKLGDATIVTDNVIWTAGSQATPVAQWLGVEPGQGGRVAVDPQLHPAGQPVISIIGDAALVLGKDGKPLPGLAPVAKQQGEFAARAILRRLHGRRPRAGFVYRDYGTLATIGRNKAVAEFGSVQLTGFVAWLTWAVAHIFFLIGFRNRVMVTAQWVFAYMTHDRANRLIMERGLRSRKDEQ